MIDFTLNYSFQHKAIVSIMYQKGCEITQRNIKVTGIHGENVHAYCYKRKAIRVFKKENILAAFVPGMTIKHRAVTQAYEQ